MSMFGEFFLKNLDFNAVQQMAVRNFNQCCFPKCSKFSLGFQCVDCSTFVCNDHLYFKLGTPPVPVCSSCIAAKESPEVSDDQ